MIEQQYNYNSYLFLRSGASPPPLEIRRRFWRCRSRLNGEHISPVPRRTGCASRGCRGDPGSGSVCSACTEAQATAAGQCPAQHPWIRWGSERVAAPAWGCPLQKTELRLQDSEASLWQIDVGARRKLLLVKFKATSDDCVPTDVLR